ncbi:hypothetical protein [Couchioplanes azureus]|uniref:hypothetical protein n=1 Tax=Couchioplanes caeruleus TaxID=56438 RepID=UPI0016708AD8|nr:hypothetical protein [Couchioplanes caeruleus]
MRWPASKTTYQQLITATVERLAADRFATGVIGEVRNSAGMLRGLVPLTVAAHEKAGARFFNDAILLNVIGTAAACLPQQGELVARSAASRATPVPPRAIEEGGLTAPAAQAG